MYFQTIFEINGDFGVLRVRIKIISNIKQITVNKTNERLVSIRTLLPCPWGSETLQIIIINLAWNNYKLIRVKLPP